MTRLKWLLGGVIAIVWLGVYLQSAFAHAAAQNLDMTFDDQSAYLDYARHMSMQDYQYPGDRNRMPVYPLLQSLHYDRFLTEQDYFEQARAFNIWLSVPLLIGIFVLLIKRLPGLYTLNLMLLTSFTIFVFKSAYVQTELLFYFLFFCAFLLTSRLLIAPQLWLGALTGGVLGITHLTKASIPPLMGLFLGIAGLKLAYDLRGNLTRESMVTWLKNAAAFALVPVVSLLIVWPYLQHSKAVYGRYFYNVNSTFYVWTNSWTEAGQTTKAAGDRVGWPDLPDDQIPSPSKYLSEHNFVQIFFRFMRGAVLSTGKHCIGYLGYCHYVLLVGGVSVAAVMLNWRLLRPFINDRNIWLLLFWGGFLLLYYLLYVWYYPINNGQRFMLSLFLPLMYLFGVLLARLREQTIRIGGQSVAWVPLLNRAILLLLLIEIPLIVTVRIYTVYGGR